MKYSYPRLSNHDLSFLRLSGPGLANCMFMAARSYVCAMETGLKFISPTWRKVSIGPLLRGERDKRAYSSLFYDYGIQGLKKSILLLNFKFNKNKFYTIDSIKGYFTPLHGKHDIVKGYFDKIARPETLSELKDIGFENTIAVHVRLGDYSAERRIALTWYKEVIQNLQKINGSLKFALFSDGSDDELKLLTELPNVQRHFYGNAFADMVAISKCRLVVASDSTFSAWGAYLGQCPIIFSRRHFPPVYGKEDQGIEFILEETTDIPVEIVHLIK